MGSRRDALATSTMPRARLALENRFRLRFQVKRIGLKGRHVFHDPIALFRLRIDVVDARHVLRLQIEWIRNVAADLEDETALRAFRF